MRLREVFHLWGVEGDAEKSAERSLDSSSLGAEQLGEAGLLGSQIASCRGRDSSAVAWKRTWRTLVGPRSCCPWLVRPCIQFSFVVLLHVCLTASTLPLDQHV